MFSIQVLSASHYWYLLEIGFDGLSNWVVKWWGLSREINKNPAKCELDSSTKKSVSFPLKSWKKNTFVVWESTHIFILFCFVIFVDRKATWENINCVIITVCGNWRTDRHSEVSEMGSDFTLCVRNIKIILNTFLLGEGCKYTQTLRCLA